MSNPEVVLIVTTSLTVFGETLHALTDDASIHKGSAAAVVKEKIGESVLPATFTLVTFQ